MLNKFYIGVVVLLWLVGMTWLVTAKILPPFGQGKPPSYVGLQVHTQTCWRVYWNDQPIGWSASEVLPGSGGTKEIHARLLIQNFKFADMAGQWAEQIKHLGNSLGAIDLDSRSRLELDPHGHLSSLETRVQLNPMGLSFSVRGQVTKSELELQVKAGSFSHTVEKLVPENARLGAEMSPDATMPGMYVGRRWQMQVINPFPTGEASYLIDAEVTQEEIISYDNKMVIVRRLEYRRVETAGVDDSEAVQTILWIAENGTVLRQQANILGSKVRFERKLDEKSLAWAKTITDPTHQTGGVGEP